MLNSHSSLEGRQSDFGPRLGKEICAVLAEFVAQNHGIVSAVEAFAAYNSLRAVDPVTPAEFMAACRQAGADAPLRLQELPNQVFVLRLAGLTDEGYFSAHILPLLDPQGIGPEALARRLDISLSLARVLLDAFLGNGSLCLDDSIEGRLYFQNEILAADLSPFKADKAR